MENKEKNKEVSYRYPGIHGLTVYIRDILAASCRLITNDDFLCSSVMWIQVAESFILGALYLPHEGSDHYYSDVFEDLTSDICRITEYNLPIMLTGDFNSRTGTQNEINVLDHSDDIDDYKFPNIISILENLNIPLERKNSDKKTNNNGNKLISMCKITETCILNGRVGSDRYVGDLTYGTSSTIDYAICSPNFLPFILDFKIDSLDHLLSDKHKPLCIKLT